MSVKERWGSGRRFVEAAIAGKEVSIAGLRGAKRSRPAYTPIARAAAAITRMMRRAIDLIFPISVLFSAGYGEPFVFPIDAKTGGQVENPHFAKAEFLQLGKCRTDIGAMIPRAAAAINHHRHIFGQAGGPRSQLLHAFRLPGRANVFRAGNVGLSVELLRARVQDHGLL